MATIPDWRPRPTEPGLWWCESDRKSFPQAVAMRLTAADIERGAPFGVSMVYGPIPEPPNTGASK